MLLSHKTHKRHKKNRRGTKALKKLPTIDHKHLSVGPLLGITYGNGEFVAVSDNGTILTSSDGVTWDSRASGVENRLSGITYGNGQFVVTEAD